MVLLFFSSFLVPQEAFTIHITIKVLYRSIPFLYYYSISNTYSTYILFLYILNAIKRRKSIEFNTFSCLAFHACDIVYTFQLDKKKKLQYSYNIVHSCNRRYNIQTHCHSNKHSYIPSFIIHI